MKKHFTKKRAAVLTVVAMLLGAAAAFAYFTSTGSGTGSAKTGRASNLTISQIGAGYDSLVTTNTYVEDQCMSGCDGPSEFGNDITLANPGYQQLVNFVVAVRNWGPAITGGPITLSINNTVAGAVSKTQAFNIPAATVVNSEPSTTNLTFDLASEGIFVSNEFVYGITFGDPTGVAPGDPTGESSLNIALSSSATDLSVGTDTTPGSVWMNDSYGDNGDFPYTNAPTCTTNSSLPTTGFAKVVTDLCPSIETLAYGTPAQVAAGSADIPAVEVNVVGGVGPVLYPGAAAQPLEFAITNPGTGPVSVNQVSASVAADTSGGPNNGDLEEVPGNVGSDVGGCAASWYQINGSPDTVGLTVPPGTTLFTTTSTPASALSIQMNDTSTNQDACEGATVGLSFSSN